MTEFTDEELDNYMMRCIDVAKSSPKGIWKPYVGALILSKDRKVIAQGCKIYLEHTSMTVHAERCAIDKVGSDLKGGTLVTTLEPCVKTRSDQLFSSCSELIVRSGIQTVVLGLIDDLSKFDGYRGVKYLESNGVTVIKHLKLADLIRQELTYGDRYRGGCYAGFLGQ